MTKSPASLIDKLVISLTIFFTLILYLHLGRDYLFDWDEGIYAELGRELLELKNWLTPTWNYQLWLEKPPGIAWVTALGLKLFGINAFGARLLMPIFAGLTLYFVYLIGKKLKDEYLGAIAFLLLSNMNLFLSRARAVNTDGALLLSITATIYLVMTNAPPLFVALAISFGVLFKGLAGFLALFVALPLLFNKSFKYMLHATSYMLLTIIPWHIYQLIQHGSQFITPYFKEQVLRRATVPIEFHLESRWYYFRYLYENLGFGRLFLLTLGISFLTYKIIHSKLQATSYMLLTWWFLFPLSLFTLAKTRLFWYILPIYPAIALIIAYFLRFLADQKIGQQLLSAFLFLYTIATFQHLLQNIELHRQSATPPPKIALAQTAATMPTKELLVLVPQTERLAEAILPKEQRISSSFRYGGAPSLVFYARKPVIYFYHLDKFQQSLSHGSLVLLTKDDYQQLSPLPLHIIKTRDNYLLGEIK